MVNFIRLEKASWASVGKPQWQVDSEFYQPLNFTILPSIIFAIIIFFENLSWFKKDKQQKNNHMKNVYLKNVKSQYVLCSIHVNVNCKQFCSNFKLTSYQFKNVWSASLKPI